MDPVTIATATVSLLSPYLGKMAGKFAEEAGGAAWNKVTQLYETLKAKFATDSRAQSALNDLEQAPDDETSQTIVHAHLKKMLTADPEFGKQLVEMLKQADKAGVDAVFNTNIHGDVENLVNIGVVHGDFNLGGSKPHL